jgi:hypothetical protein
MSRNIPAYAGFLCDKKNYHARYDDKEKNPVLSVSVNSTRLFVYNNIALHIVISFRNIRCSEKQPFYYLSR